ncbi:hypothetical protein [Methylobacterium sp. J-068]|uniref:hypothetical protein n=1 Tax=Methylobacterium sp. J-068 TaxID=2836649 RepID=UPI001FB9C763|nr:hypothetical protein [Methylobacterium sp. J-068]MCJ2032761.1 hypothetical protein [Methylobacterium sp. J-068]
MKPALHHGRRLNDGPGVFRHPQPGAKLPTTGTDVEEITDAWNGSLDQGKDTRHVIGRVDARSVTFERIDTVRLRQHRRAIRLHLSSLQCV